jgi:hypothetical protein
MRTVVVAIMALLLLATTAAAQTMSVDPADPIVIEVPLNADPPTSFVVNITADRTTNWIVTGLPKWLKADATFGRTPATVTFTVTPPSKTIGASYGVTLSFTNLRTRLGDTTRAVAVEVVAEESAPLPKVGWIFEHGDSQPYFRQAGENVRFVWTLINTGSEPNNNARIQPEMWGDGPIPNCPATPQPLKTGEEIYCEHRQVATDIDVTAGKIEQWGFAYGSSFENPDHLSVMVTIPYRPDLPVIPPRFLLCEPPAGYCLDNEGKRLVE